MRRLQENLNSRGKMLTLPQYAFTTLHSMNLVTVDMFIMR